jgi:hypothetical protein
MTVGTSGLDLTPRKNPSGTPVNWKRRSGLSALSLERSAHRDFGKAWVKACEAPGIPGMIPQDPRREAIRSLECAYFANRRLDALKLVELRD